MNFVEVRDNISLFYSITSMASTSSRIIIVNAGNVFLYNYVFVVEALAKGMKVGTCLACKLGYLKPGDTLIRGPLTISCSYAGVSASSNACAKNIIQIAALYLVYIVN